MKTKMIYSLGVAMLAAGFLFAQDKAPAKVEAKPAMSSQPAKTVPAQNTATPAAPASESEMTFEKTEYNYGTIKQGDVVNYEFKFTNTGKDPLVISQATGSCGCTVPEWPKEPIKKGGTGVIKVTFNSAGKSGMQDKTVTITSNAKGSPHMLHIKGNVEVPAATGGAQPAVNPAPVKIEPAKK